MSNLSPVIRQRFFTQNGAPLAGGKVYTYEAGTSTPLATYTDSSGSTPNANPVILDANGEANIWISTSSYKFILKDSSDVTQWTVDNVSTPSGGGGGGSASWGSIGGTLSSQADLQAALNLKANLASPTFTGTVSGITAAMVGAPSGSGTSTGSNTGDNSANTLYSGLAASKEDVSNKATTFGTINDTLYPTVQAVNTAINSAVVGLLDYRGSYDASTNLFPATGGSGTAGAILKGDFYICSVSGTLAGTAVTPGDLIIALIDTPAQTAANWDLISHDIGYTPENAANKATSLASPDNVKYPTTQAVATESALALKIAQNLADLNNVGTARTNLGLGSLATVSNLTGPITSTGAATAVTANAITNAMLAQIATQTFKGRTTAATGNVEDLTATQATALLNNVVGDAGAGGTKGLVPAPGAGDAAAGKMLKADGTWATPPGAGGGTTVYSGQTEIDFGAFPGASDTSLVVTGQTNITATSKITVHLTAKDTADHLADEHWVENIAVSAGNIVASTSFTIYAKNTNSLNEPIKVRQSPISLYSASATTIGIKNAQPGVFANEGGKGTMLYGLWTVSWSYVL